METVELNGIRVPLDADLMSEKIRDQLRAGRYENGEARCLPHVVEPGERVLELGAGIGYVTALAGRLGAAEVTAVEANPELIPLIGELHRLNGVKGRVLQALVRLGGGPDALPFHLHHDLWASSATPLKSRNLKGTVEAPAISLDALLQREAPSLLIVDLEVLRGWMDAGPDPLAELDLAGPAKLVVELKPGRFSPAEIKQVFDAVSGQGFYCDPIVTGGGVVLFRRLG